MVVVLVLVVVIIVIVVIVVIVIVVVAVVAVGTQGNLGRNFSVIRDDWMDSGDTGAEFVGDRGRLEAFRGHWG